METTFEKSINKNCTNHIVRESLFEIKNLTITSASQKDLIKQIDLSIKPGEMLGLIGESGSGKSLTATALLGLLPSSLTIKTGSITFMNDEITSLSEKEMRQLRGKEVAFISQNYQSFFTPFIKIGKQFIEGIQSHIQIKKSEAKKLVLYWFNKVSLPAERVFNSYPHQLSGGQLQRAAIASAIMLKPKLIIADEPTTALDVLTGERILDLLKALQKELNCAVLLITHDLKHVMNRAEEIAVMYGGRIIESGRADNVCQDPAHPYTKLLFQSRLQLKKKVPDKLPAIYGEPGLTAEQGCPFALRCPYVYRVCNENPPTKKVSDHHWTACHAAVQGEVDQHVGN
ncbi:ABC transporter ATP-binding protein [Fictibacillus arsenicus]|uniref:ABC transporter ATP-binding protein n=1 Tax=Fictibacillus arsenicus TaxID=255247 RepID=UPI0009F685A2|nr:ABC transporter ATP-binding protein [Fictibacillus arsenicus]